LGTSHLDKYNQTFSAFGFDLPRANNQRQVTILSSGVGKGDEEAEVSEPVSTKHR